MIYIYFTFSADNYTKLCTIEADLSRVPLAPRSKATGRGNFYRIDYDIILLFGMTELKAQVAWKENVSAILPFIKLKLKLNNPRSLISFFKMVFLGS